MEVPVGSKKDDFPDPFRGSSPLDNTDSSEIMKCPPERELEKLVLGRIQLGKKDWLVGHLKYCFTCYELYTDFTSFYKGSRREFSRRGALPGMAAPLPKPFSDQIVHLSPRELSWPSDEINEDDYQRLSTLTSQGGNLEGAFLFSRGSNEILVALRTSEGRRLSNVPLQVGKFKNNFLTDSSGLALIGKHDPSLFLNTRMTVYLHLFDITTHVGTELVEEEHFNPEPIPDLPLESILVYVDEELTLCLELGFGAENVDHPLTAVFVASGETRMVPVSDGFATIAKLPLGTPIQILIYPC